MTGRLKDRQDFAEVEPFLAGLRESARRDLVARPAALSCKKGQDRLGALP